MKKIFLVIAMIGAGIGAKAQLTSSAVADLKIMTIAEANRLNGTAQPTINGRPYSEYKADQNALKQQALKATAINPAPMNGNGIVNAQAPIMQPELINKPGTPGTIVPPAPVKSQQTMSPEAVTKLNSAAKQPVITEPAQKTGPAPGTVVAPVVTIVKDGPETTEVKTTPVPVPVQNDKPKND